MSDGGDALDKKLHQIVLRYKKYYSCASTNSDVQSEVKFCLCLLMFGLASTNLSCLLMFALTLMSNCLQNLFINIIQFLFRRDHPLVHVYTVCLIHWLPYLTL